jgi:hypothetical protein
MAFKMKGKPYKMGTHKTKATMAYMKSPLEQGEEKSPLEQKLNPGPIAAHRTVTDPETGKKKRVYSEPWKGYEHKEGGKALPGEYIRDNEEQWYKDNPGMSPTREEQMIFEGKDEKATEDQFWWDGTKGVGPNQAGKTKKEMAESPEMKRLQEMNLGRPVDRRKIKMGKNLERRKDMREFENEDKPITWPYNI